MKKIFVPLLFLLTCTICFAQKLSKEERAAALKEKKASSVSNSKSNEELNFKLEDDNKVTWQKVIEFKNLDKDSLTNVIGAFLKNNSFSNNLTFENDGFSGRSAKVMLSSNKGLVMGTYSPYSGFIRVDVKDERYRITVTDIVFEGIETGISSGGITLSTAQPLSLEDFVVKVKGNKGVYRTNGGVIKLLTILNNDLTNYLTLKKDKSKDNW